MVLFLFVLILLILVKISVEFFSFDEKVKRHFFLKFWYFFVAISPSFGISYKYSICGIGLIVNFFSFFLFLFDTFLFFVLSLVELFKWDVFLTLLLLENKIIFYLLFFNEFFSDISIGEY